MKLDKIGKVTSVTIDLREISPDGLREHYLSQFPEELGEIIRRVLQETASPGETVKVDMMDGPDLIAEHKYQEGLNEEDKTEVICDLSHKMVITVTQEFPLA